MIGNNVERKFYSVLESDYLSSEYRPKIRFQSQCEQ